MRALVTGATARVGTQSRPRWLVHTSTIDVFHAEPGTEFDESQVADDPTGSAYERSKQRAEELALATASGAASSQAQARGLPAVALDTTVGNTRARALYAGEGFREVAYRAAGRGLPGFVALVKPLR